MWLLRSDEAFLEARKSHSDLLAKLVIQIRALEVSSKGFDEGELWEAERLATSVCNILFDRPNAKSLLGGHLNILQNIKFISSCPPKWIPPAGMEHFPAPTSLIPAQGFVVLDCHGFDRRFSPAFDGGNPDKKRFTWLNFGEWWAEHVFTTWDGDVICRGDLVKILRDKDGGSHIDSKIDNKAYNILAKDAIPGALLGENPITEIHYIVMRQIAWEVQISIERAAHLIFSSEHR